MSTEFINKSGLEFTDISSERVRIYKFPGGDIVRIDGPKKLHVSSSGGHRVFANDGCHYIPAGWIHIHWTVWSGEAHFDL